MRDGVEAARRGIPAVSLVTEKFWPQGDFVAMSEGMTDLPRIKLPHPVAGSGQEHMAKVAVEIRDQLVRSIEGR
ncbi:MAG: hypothetical protein GY724_23475 [Actinomycetia bacterium]|nr:hypothetical protein [Actinomycetes bacterium]MCP4225392.1 hypothetical protein [Actinomycetes bacterium]MCP5031485.1 hypothetical protein [Actinomycetes bacterium]